MRITNAAICHEFYINGKNTLEIAKVFKVPEYVIANKKAKIPKKQIDRYRLAMLEDQKKRGAA